ncbi:MAG: hypothetical protein KF747_05140 [Nitrospira sp.]|nr:hypothetical protein [Nitrospira sp.]
MGFKHKSSGVEVGRKERLQRGGGGYGTVYGLSNGCIIVSVPTWAEEVFR